MLLAPNAVTTEKILDASVTTAKLADMSVTLEKIADGAVDPSKMQQATAMNQILTTVPNTTTPTWSYFGVSNIADNSLTLVKLEKSLLND